MAVFSPAAGALRLTFSSLRTACWLCCAAARGRPPIYRSDGAGPLPLFASIQGAFPAIRALLFRGMGTDRRMLFPAVGSLKRRHFVCQTASHCVETFAMLVYRVSDYRARLLCPMRPNAKPSDFHYASQYWIAPSSTRFAITQERVSECPTLSSLTVVCQNSFVAPFPKATGKPFLQQPANLQKYQSQPPICRLFTASVTGRSVR